MLVLHLVFGCARVSGGCRCGWRTPELTYCVLSVLKPNFAVRVPRTGSPSLPHGARVGQLVAQETCRLRRGAVRLEEYSCAWLLGSRTSVRAALDFVGDVAVGEAGVVKDLTVGCSRSRRGTITSSVTLSATSTADKVSLVQAVNPWSPGYPSLPIQSAGSGGRCFLERGQKAGRGVPGVIIEAAS